MTLRDALLALAAPEPEPFGQTRPTLADTERWDEWNRRRIEALKFARTLEGDADYVTQYETRVPEGVREWAEALIERWRAEGRSDLVADDLMRSLVLGAYVMGTESAERAAA